MTPDQHVAIDELFEAARISSPPVSIRAHLEVCARFRITHVRLRRAFSALRRVDRTPLPPRDLLLRVKSLFERRPVRAIGIVETIARLVDQAGGMRLATAGVRGSDAATSRMQFSADQLEVHIALERGADGRDLTAQILPGTRPSEYGLAWAESDGQMIRETVVEPHGLFTLDGLPLEPIDLVVEIGDNRTRMRLPITENDDE